jgi:LysM repeat protein
MRRNPKYSKKPITFKQATIIVLSLHAAAAFCFFVLEFQSSKKIDNNKAKIVVGPSSDALDLNWPHKKTKPQIVATLNNKNKKTETQKPNVVPTPKQIIPKPQEYILSSGDNFYTVSRKLGVSFSELAKYNNITDVRTLKVGQILKVPQDS